MAEKERKITTILEEKFTPESIKVNADLEKVVKSVQANYPIASIEIDSLDAIPAKSKPEPQNAFVELVGNAITDNDSAAPAVILETIEVDGNIVVEIADGGPRIPEMEGNLLTCASDLTPLYYGSGFVLCLVTKLHPVLRVRSR